MDTIAGIEQFPVLASQPAGSSYDPTQPIKLWQPGVPVAGSGKVAYPYLANDASVAFNSIPAAQYNAANVPPPVLPAGVASNSNVIPPPVDLAKFNALAGEGEEIVATPFGLIVEQIAMPAAPAPSGDSAAISACYGLLEQIAAKLGV